MSASPTNHPPGVSRAPATVHVSADEIRRIVAESAEQAETREAFLQQLASQLLQWMSAALVAIDAHDWDGPRMLVRDETIANGIDREIIRQLLASAGPSVASASIHCQNEAAGIVMAGVPASRCGGLTVELMPSPQRASVLVVSPTDRQASELLPAMKLLAQCVDAVSKTSYGQPMPTVTQDLTHPSIDSVSNPGNGRLSDPSQELDQLARVRQSLRSFHADLDPTATAYRIASELPRLLPCERAVVLLAESRARRRPRYRVAAISGTSVVDRRAPLVRSMNQLASKLAILRRPLILPVPDDAESSSAAVEELPPQLTAPLDDYLDESGVLSVTVLPVFASSESVDGENEDPLATPSANAELPIAIMLLETFTGDADTEISPAMIEISHEASTALGNAITHDSVFALPMRRPLAGVSRSVIRHWVLAIALTLIGLSVYAYVTPTNHYVVAKGTARASERQAVFAGIDGIVKEVAVQDGERVGNGDPLVQLDNAELTRESEALAGQLATTTEKLASLRAMQVAGKDDVRETAQSVIEQRALENEIETLSKRIQINDLMKAKLSISAPIDGVVVGWQLSQRLLDRPISRGDRLLAVVNADGPWELDLKLDESKAKEVLRLHGDGQEVAIEFAIETHPTETFSARLTEVGSVARRASDGRNVVDVVARIEDIPDSGFRSDAIVTAKLYCGERRLISSLTQDLVDWWHRHVMFRLRSRAAVTGEP